MLARFLTNTRGGVTPLMAVVAVPLMASVGIAVDYSRINAARTAFQVALDATAMHRIQSRRGGRRCTPPSSTAPARRPQSN